MPITHVQQAKELVELRIMVEQLDRAVARLAGDTPVYQTETPEVVTEPDPEEQARREFEAADERKAHDLEMADWMRSKGLVPAGKALEAVRNGERDPRTLRKMNVDDGLILREKGVPAGGKPKAEPKPEAKAPSEPAPPKSKEASEVKPFPYPLTAKAEKANPELVQNLRAAGLKPEQVEKALSHVA